MTSSKHAVFTHVLYVISNYLCLVTSPTRWPVAQLVLSINYCNSLLHGANNGVLQKLQCAQKRLARVLCNYGVRDHNSDDTIDVLHEIHWLPVPSWVTYKIALTCYKAHRLGQPPYLEMMLHQYIPSRSLHSSDSGLLTIPESKTKTADRCFSFVCCFGSLECSPTDYLRC